MTTTLTDAFQAPNKQLRKISIPMLIYLADYAIEQNRPMQFRLWFEYFTEEDPLFEDYKKFCSSGSTKLEKLNGRLAVMAKSFARYSETEIPEELVEKVKALEKEDVEKGEVEKENSEVENKESLEAKIVDNLELEIESKETMEYDDMEIESGEESKVAEVIIENLDLESMENDEVEIQ